MSTLVFAIVGVAVATAALVLGWSLHVIREAERMQPDPRLLRRRLLTLGLIYVCSSGWGIVQVARGDYLPEALIGIAVAATFAWLLIKQASKVNPDPH
jgi:hypothetical protein